MPKGLEVWGGGEGTGRDTCSPIRALLCDPWAVWTRSTLAHPLVGVVTVGNVVWGLAEAVRFQGVTSCEAQGWREEEQSSWGKMKS